VTTKLPRAMNREIALGRRRPFVPFDGIPRSANRPLPSIPPADKVKRSGACGAARGWGRISCPTVTTTFPYSCPVSTYHGCHLHSYQYFIVLGDRFFYLFEMKNIRLSEFCIDNRFHESRPDLR
jgi:hypothetical protein